MPLPSPKMLPRRLDQLSQARKAKLKSKTQEIRDESFSKIIQENYDKQEIKG